jgi:hypothetical protein
MAERLRRNAGSDRVVACVGLRRVREALDGFDADDCGNRCDFEASPGIAEVLLDGGDIEPPGNLLSGRDGETVAGDFDKASTLEFVLERFALAFCTHQPSRPRVA